jgi:hypothetical protein
MTIGQKTGSRGNKKDPDCRQDPIIKPDRDIYNSNGILVFRTEDIYQKTVADLKAKLSSYQPVLPPIGEHLDKPTEDQLKQELELLANLEKPLRDFETSYSFKSLRLVLFNEFNEFMRTNTEDNPVNHPQYHYIQDHAEQAVLNKWVEVNVGGVWFRMTPVGRQTYKSREELEASRSSAGDEGRKLQASFCTTNKISRGLRKCPSNPWIRIQAIVYHVNWPGFLIPYEAGAITQCYWFWGQQPFPFPAYHYASVYGDVSAMTQVGCFFQNSQCAIRHPFNVNLVSFNQQTSSRAWHRLCVPSVTARRWVRARHFSCCCPALGMFETVLTW